MYQRLLKECISDLKGQNNYSNAEEIEAYKTSYINTREIHSDLFLVVFI